MRCGTVCVQLSLHCIVCAVVEWHCFFVLKFEAAASKFVCQLHVMKKVVKDVLMLGKTNNQTAVCADLAFI